MFLGLKDRIFMLKDIFSERMTDSFPPIIFIAFFMNCWLTSPAGTTLRVKFYPLYFSEKGSEN